MHTNFLTGQGQKGNIFYVSTECAARPCAAAPAHSKLSFPSPQIFLATIGLVVMHLYRDWIELSH